MHRFALYSLIILSTTCLTEQSTIAVAPTTVKPAKKAQSGSVQKTHIGRLQDPVVQVDDKVTSDEKQHYNAVVDQANQYADDQAAALNKIPGLEVTTEDLKEKKKEGISLNPIKWLFGPVIRLQEQSVKLEQQIMKLTGPIAALQPSMLSLEKRMTSMQGQLGHLEETTTTVQDELVSIRKDITDMHNTLNEIKKPVTDLKGPIMSLRDPILKIEKPITGVDKDLGEVKTLLSLVLTSIYAAAIIIAAGTPIAAIMVWRNRQKLLPQADVKELREEEKIKQATKTMDHQLRS
jgi:chromosome segregation ATPase